MPTILANPEVKSSRLVHLDYLRGYFILVIIIDHLSRFPSAWQFITGRGILWATAAEGFVIISGLMIGYVRGFKNSSSKFTSIALKLIKRALLLYVWMVIMSLFYVFTTWQLASYRSMPWYNAPTGGWATVWHQVITMQLPHPWVHFLYLYTYFLLFSIPVVWLLRQKQPWIVACLSIIFYIYGQFTHTEWLKIQIIFFIPAIIGYYLPNIQAWWHNYRYKNNITAAILITAGVSVVISVLYTFFPNIMPHASIVNGWFDGANFGIPRIAVSSIWFMALLFIFNKITPWLKKYTFGIIEYFGTHSLTAYIGHGVVILAMSLVLLPANNFLLNTLLGAIALLGVYFLIRVPFIKRFLPR